MKYKFIKMHGCGNDYVYFDCIRGVPINTNLAKLAKRLSDRHFGIGGDGIVLILPPEDASISDAKMRMFNADGSEGQMCGNAIRCVGKFIYENNIAKKECVFIDTLSGVKELKLFAKDDQVFSVLVNMGRAEMENRRLFVNRQSYITTYVNVGNPHIVMLSDDVNAVDLPTVGPRFENHPLFPNGVNTEFVQLINNRKLKMRVWERGSGETLACGTGACAAVSAAVFNDHCKANEDIEVELLGGKLIIRYTEENVFMTGGCEKIFEGTIEIA